MTLQKTGFFSCPTQVRFGVNAIDGLRDILGDGGWRNVLCVVDPALVDSKIMTRIAAVAEAAGVTLTQFSEIDPEPKDKSVVAGAALCQTQKSEAIIALGGGSAIDVAKTIGILATNGGVVADLEGVDRFSIAPLPLIAIPSTAGTGSEVSGAAVITDTARNVKMAIRHARFGPAMHAILDPLAISTVPAHVAVHAGVDAFVHAFESYLSKLANPWSDAVNLHAMRLISENIRPYVANRENTQAALGMQNGSALAALSFGTTGLGNVHCMAMVLGSRYPVPHGLANAVCLPHAARFNLIANPARFGDVARVMGMNVRGVPEREAAQMGLDAIGTLCDDLSVPKRLRDLDVTEDSLDTMAKHAFQLNYNRWNPRHTTEADFISMFRSAY
ncbi:iron-containing alcohol dehydrogenase [Hwanghaeella grinnelliae]|uniref:Alcohol dehydrogenase 2 n=1 Tax=Hwanghaeella grinnelliae TaxID=2500179 RepID=A0A3S2W644_9PROT|nr:iron-containing alcohol dehydrogenase [Hwanghaeella grinnelliae]RVU38130.1 iron-containing alcohol dehydrogenase [Hwanghaeella grinnelliae]